MNKGSIKAWASKAILLLSVMVLAASLSACGSKNLVSLAKLDTSDLYVGDKWGNTVMVGNPSDFLDALKGAKKVNDDGVTGSVDLAQSSHTLWSGKEKVYYQWENKHAIFVDSKQNKTVYSVDLQSLLLAVPGLPPHITEGPGNDPSITGAFADLAKVDTPSAAVFRSGDKALVMVAAGKKPTGGYKMTLENAKIGNGGIVEIQVRLDAPAGAADTVISYPYLEFSLAKYADVEVTLASKSGTRDTVERVNLAVVEPDQDIIVYRPDRGSLLTERVRMYGFAKTDLSSFTVTVEDGHNVLGQKNVGLSGSASGWSYFDFNMDLQPATSPSGTVEFSSGGDTLTRVPVSFGGK